MGPRCSPPWSEWPPAPGTATPDGDPVWQAFRAQNDPEAVLTLHDGQSFPYGAAPADPTGVVLPDAGSVRAEPVTADPTGSATTSVAGKQSTELAAALSGITLGTGRGMSNAAVVSGAHTTSGNPIAVFGPQTGYFAPQLLMVQELQGPGISARGVAFAGLNLYVLLGRGQDYAWSATSAGQDITDTYALPLCTTDGSTPTLNTNRYLLRRAVPGDGGAGARQRVEAEHGGRHRGRLVPDHRLADPAGPGRLARHGRRQAARVHPAPLDVPARGRVGDRVPDVQRPGRDGRRRRVQDLGEQRRLRVQLVLRQLPAVRVLQLRPQPGAGRRAPTRTCPTGRSRRTSGRATTRPPTLATYAATAAHPQSINQDYYVSWNNKAAKDFSAADGNFSFGAVHRGDLLDRLVGAAVRSGTKLDRAALTRLVEKAGLTDLRGIEVLDELLRVLQSQPVTDTAPRGRRSRSSRRGKPTGALRVETAKGSKVYQHAEAIRIFDAWWPLLVSGEFKASLGDDLFQNMINALQLNQSASGKQRGQIATLRLRHRGTAAARGFRVPVRLVGLRRQGPAGRAR